MLKVLGAIALSGRQVLPYSFDRASLEASPGWERLPRRDRERVSRLLNTQNPLRERAQASAMKLMDSPAWKKGAAEQARLLVGLPTRDDVLPDYSYELGPEPRVVTGEAKGKPQGPFKVPINDARGARFEGNAWGVNIGGRDLTIVVAPQGTASGYANFERSEVEQALTRMDPRARRQLTRIVLAPGPSPFESKRMPQQKATRPLFIETNEKGEAIVWALPLPRRSVELLTKALNHEGYHPPAIRAFNSRRAGLAETDAQNTPEWRQWTAACEQDGTFFSRFAFENHKTRPAEDFVETVAVCLALGGVDAIRNVAPARARILDEILPKLLARLERGVGDARNA